MALENLRLKNFRSYKGLNISLGEKATIIVGPNASGKTNLLEAIYVLSTTKSFRAKDSELVNYGQDFYRLEANKTNNLIAIAYQDSKDLSLNQAKTKKISHDGNNVSQVQHIGTLQSVLFEPNDLLLVYGSPDRRRRYIDGILGQSKKEYLKSLINYRRVLKQRNKLLSERASKQDLFAWDMKLSEYASEIYTSRRNLFDHLNKKLGAKYKAISNDKVGIILDFKSSLPYSDLTSCFESLQEFTERDLAAGFTTVGPHRDDFRIHFEGEEIDKIASRGEIRSVILALKALELELFEEVYGAKPILLLDDVFSELDEQRRAFLVDMVKDYQTVITTTNADSVMESLSGDYKIIYTKDLQNG